MASTRVMRIIARMNVGGPAVEIAELMRGLPSSEFEQRLLTGYCGDDEADFIEEQAPDIAAERIDGLGRSIRAGADARAFGSLVAQIRRFRPHIVHTHTAKAGLLGRLAVKTAGSRARVVHTHHGHLLHGYFGPAMTRGVIEAERGLARITDVLVTVGASVRDDLLRARIGRPDQYRVVYSGVRLGALPDRDAAREALGIAPQSVVVSMIGRLARIKRPDRLLDLARIVRSEAPAVRFLVAGWGDEGPAMARAVAREQLPVTLLGWRDDLERILAATDVIVLTSDNEGTPLSLVQAALAGVPAVATKVGSVPEVVIDGVTGRLTAPSAQALSAALAPLVHDAQERRRLGSAAYGFARDRFDPASFIDAHAEIYRGSRP